MANIPTVPGSEIDVHTPEQAVHLDAGALAGPRLRGAQAFAGAVQGLGDEAGSLAAGLEKARNARIAADVDLRMRTARQTFIEGLRNDPNEHEWADRAREMSDNVREEIASAHDKVPPGMRQEVDQSFRAWQASVVSEAQTMANVQGVNRARGKLLEDYTEALRDGHADHAANVLGLMRSTRVAAPEEVDKLERDIPKTIAMNYVENGLAGNPLGTTDLLKSGASLPAVDQNGKPIVPSKVFTPRQMEALINTGRIRTAAWQKTNFEAMLANDADPVTGLYPEEMVRDKMKSREIDEVAGRNFLAAQERKARADTALAAREAKAADAQANALLSARTHDPTAWGVNPDLYAHELIQDAAGISDPALRQKAINDVNHQLAAVKKTGETAERPVERQMYQLMNDDRETNGAMLPVSVTDVPEAKRSGGFLGFGKVEAAPAQTKYVHVPGGLSAVKKETFDMSQYPGMTKEQVIASINVHSAKLQNEMAQWFKTPEGQKATFDQANAHRQEIERPYVMDAVREKLARKAPAVVTTREEYDALPSGAPFSWNGRIGYKP